MGRPATEPGGRPRPTRLALAPLLAAGALAGVSSLTGNTWLQLLASLVLALPVVAVLLAPRLGGVRVRLEVPVPPHAGGLAGVVVTVTAPAGRASPPCVVTLELDLLAPLALAVPALAPGRSAVLRAEVAALHRGVVEAWRASATSSAPLGLLRSRAVVAGDGRLVVHPRPAPPLPRPAVAGADGQGAVRPVTGGGTEPHAVRDWRAGDPAQRVHWRTTARTGRLAVVERAAEGSGTVTVVVGGARGDAEEALAVGCATAVAALRDGAAVRLVDADGTLALVGADAAGAAQDWFAAVDPAGPPGRPAGAGSVLAVGADGARWRTGADG